MCERERERESSGGEGGPGGLKSFLGSGAWWSFFFLGRGAWGVFFVGGG